MHLLWAALLEAFSMFWMTFWALVFGFGVSAVLQVIVRREQMERAFGETTAGSVLLAMIFGAASSSCSYAAAAAGRSAVARGAAIIPALAFMFASTNLVVELGALIWLLMGWRFVLAEVAGAFVLIAAMWLFVKLFMPQSLRDEARRHAEQTVTDEHCCHGPASSDGPQTKVRALASAFVGDWSMLWKELVAGFLIAGLLATVVPTSWWRAFFVEHGPLWFRMIENALVAPLIAALSFICSCGNIPLAAVLWSNGISFGGVISFIYADLIAIPLLIIYAKYYGRRAGIRIALILYLAMVVAGFVIEIAFQLLGLVPSHTVLQLQHEMGFTWNYTAWLNVVAALLLIAFFAIHWSNRGTRSAHAHH